LIKSTKKGLLVFTKRPFLGYQNLLSREKHLFFF
jgi:hypothetical protein